MQEKHEGHDEEDLFFCFVDFEPAAPRVFVVPASVVAESLKKDHEIWLSMPGRNGQPHNPTKMRRLRPKMFGKDPDWLDQYEEKWHLIAPDSKI